MGKKQRLKMMGCDTISPTSTKFVFLKKILEGGRRRNQSFHTMLIMNCKVSEEICRSILFSENMDNANFLKVSQLIKTQFQDVQDMVMRFV